MERTAVPARTAAATADEHGDERRGNLLNERRKGECAPSRFAVPSGIREDVASVRDLHEPFRPIFIYLFAHLLRGCLFTLTREGALVLLGRVTASLRVDEARICILSSMRQP